jgi:hypothetical protein
MTLGADLNFGKMTVNNLVMNYEDGILYEDYL